MWQLRFECHDDESGSAHVRDRARYRGCGSAGKADYNLKGWEWFEVEWGVVCEWDVPLSMLGKSLKVAVCLSGPETVIFRAGDATRVWTAGGRGLDLSMRWEWEMIPLERIY